MNPFVEIKEKSQRRLIISTRGDLFLGLLFFVTMFSMIFLLIMVSVVIPEQINKLKPSVIIVGVSLFLFGGFWILKFLNLLFYQSFGFDYYVEKSADDEVFIYYKLGTIQFPASRIPKNPYLLDYQVSFLGKFGFKIYFFGPSGKENIISGGFFRRLMYTLLNPPFMKLELRYDSREESKEISRQILFEIRKLLREERYIVHEKKTPLMKMEITPEEVRTALAAGVDVNARDTIVGNTALFYAAGCDPDIDPLQWAEPNYSSLAELIRSGADVNACNLFNERIIDYIRKCTKNTTNESSSLSRLKTFLESYGYRTV